MSMHKITEVFHYGKMQEPPDEAYLEFNTALLKTSMGFHRQVFVESMGPTWIPFFEDIS